MNGQEAPAARIRRQEHERILEQLYAEGRVDEAQRRLDEWHREDRASRRPVKEAAQ